MCASFVSLSISCTGVPIRASNGESSKCILHCGGVEEEVVVFDVFVEGVESIV